MPDDITGSLVLKSLPLVDERNNPIRISGTSDIHRDQAHQQMGRALWSHIVQHLKKLGSRASTAHRARILVACTSYVGAGQLAEGMISAGADPDSIAVAARVESESAVPAHFRRRPAWHEIPSDALERFPHHNSAKILIAPLAIAERGLNMVDHNGRSLVGEVILAVRPIPLMDEPAQLLALISSRAYSALRRSQDPAEMLRELSRTSSAVHEELFRSHHFFQSLPNQVRLSIVAEMLIGIIQLGGGDVGHRQVQVGDRGDDDQGCQDERCARRCLVRHVGLRRVTSRHGNLRDKRFAKVLLDPLRCTSPHWDDITRRQQGRSSGLTKVSEVCRER